MPEAVERRLQNVAKARGYTGRSRDAFVYGTLRHKYGWKPEREKGIGKDLKPRKRSS